MSTPTPTPLNGTGINNLTNFMNISNTTVKLIIVVGIFIILFISVGYIIKKKRR